MIKAIVSFYLTIAILFFAVFFIAKGYNHINDGKKDPSLWASSLVESLKFGICWPIFVKDLFDKDKMKEFFHKVGEAKKAFTKEDHKVLDEEGKEIEADKEVATDVKPVDAEEVKAEDHEVVLEEDQK